MTAKGRTRRGLSSVSSTDLPLVYRQPEEVVHEKEREKSEVTLLVIIFVDAIEFVFNGSLSIRLET